MSEVGVKSCFFIGHRDAPDHLAVLLQKVVSTHVKEYGVTEFVVGHYGRFDCLAAKAVLAVKKEEPKVRLSLLLCHHPAERPIKIPEGFDGLYYPPGMEKVPRRLAIVRANRYMVDHADFLIAYALHPASNARQLVEYANRRAKKGAIRVTNLAQPGQNER